MLFDSVLCERLQGCRASLSTLQNHHPCAQTHVACSETKKIWKKKCLKWQHYQDFIGRAGTAATVLHLLQFLRDECFGKPNLNALKLHLSAICEHMIIYSMYKLFLNRPGQMVQLTP